MKNEEELRELIQAKLRAGQLPRKQSDWTWGGPGSGRVCAVCEQRIATERPEIEDRDVQGKSLVFHASCHALLSQERSRDR